MFWWDHDRILNTRRLWRRKADNTSETKISKTEADERMRTERGNGRALGEGNSSNNSALAEEDRRVFEKCFHSRFLISLNTPACTPRRALTLVWCRRPSGVSIAKAVWACVCVSMRKYRSLSKRCFQVFHCCLFFLFLSLSLSFVWFHLFWFHPASRTTRCMHSG